MNPYDIEKRNQIADEIGAEIRSFDYLTDKLRTREFYPKVWLSEENKLYEELLANPFFRAMTDSEWKKFCRNEKLYTFHFYSYHAQKIIEARNKQNSI